MSKITSKLQVTIPKAIADRYGIRPGDEIEFRPAGTEIRVVPPRVERKQLSVAERLRQFDEASARSRERFEELPRTIGGDRGWTREELYTRGAAHGEGPRSTPARSKPDDG